MSARLQLLGVGFSHSLQADAALVFLLLTSESFPAQAESPGLTTDGPEVVLPEVLHPSQDVVDGEELVAVPLPQGLDVLDGLLLPQVGEGGHQLGDDPVTGGVVVVVVQRAGPRQGPNWMLGSTLPGFRLFS